MSVRDQLIRGLDAVPGLRRLALLTRETVRVCLQYRVTGLAAEAGFFALLSFPPLLFGLLGGVGYLGGWLGDDTVGRVTFAIEAYAANFLTEDSLREILVPTIRDALHDGRPEMMSIGFVLSLWSGSRALNVMIDTCSIMYEQGGTRGIVRTRIMSLSMYMVALLFAAIVVPLILIGPQLLSEWLPAQVQWLMSFYWPLVGGLTILGFATFFYVAPPVKTSWLRDVPGAVLTLVIWVGSAVVLRAVLGASVGGASIYGPLAATIVVLIWLYFLGIAVLIGAALNAAIQRLWPVDHQPAVTERARVLINDGVSRTRERWGDRAVPLPGRKAFRARQEAAARDADEPDELDEAETVAIDLQRQQRTRATR